MQKKAVTPALIPLPVEYTATEENFVIQSATIIVYKNNYLQPWAVLLEGYIQSTAAWQALTAIGAPAKNYILL